MTAMILKAFGTNLVTNRCLRAQSRIGSSIIGGQDKDPRSVLTAQPKAVPFQGLKVVAGSAAADTELSCGDRKNTNLRGRADVGGPPLPSTVSA
jgi:hypothetical protein